MYNEHFGFREYPFSINPDPRFLYFSETHKEALAHLLYGVETGKGFIVITGDVGTGKTTLLRKFLEELGDATSVIMINNPNLSREDFFLTIAQAVGLPDYQGSKAGFLGALERHLQESSAQGRRVMLVVDEAQNLSTELLEETRLLYNLETASEKLLPIVLVGQQELNDKLMTHELRQLRQRISLKFHISPLSATEAAEYIRHRLGVVRYGGPALFSPRAVKEIYSYSGGYPRMINVLCDMTLLGAYGKGVRQVNRAMVKEATHDIAASYPVSDPRAAMLLRVGWGRHKLYAVGLSLVVLLLSGLSAIWYLINH